MTETAPLPLREKYLIKDVAELRERFGDTSQRIWDKAADRLSAPMKRFIALSPFCCLSSQDAAGRTDLSPRGDPPGFVRILDDRLLLMPDRPGNRRYDSFRNIIDNPKVSLLFLIPGVLDTVRVNGSALITCDPLLLAGSAVQGKEPAAGLLITVEEAYGHCSKALRRSHLWQPETWPDAAEAPSLADLMAAHLTCTPSEENEIKDVIQRDIKDCMY